VLLIPRVIFKITIGSLKIGIDCELCLWWASLSKGLLRRRLGGKGFAQLKVQVSRREGRRTTLGPVGRVFFLHCLRSFCPRYCLDFCKIILTYVAWKAKPASKVVTSLHVGIEHLTLASLCLFTLIFTS